MNLKVYNPETVRRARSTEPHIRIAKTVIFFNYFFTSNIGLKHGDEISIVQDQERKKDWYIKIGKPGFTVRGYQKKKYYLGLLVNVGETARELVKSLGLERDRSYKFKMAINPVEIDGEIYYAILTSTAV